MRGVALDYDRIIDALLNLEGVHTSLSEEAIFAILHYPEEKRNSANMWYIIKKVDARLRARGYKLLRVRGGCRAERIAKINPDLLQEQPKESPEEAKARVLKELADLKPVAHLQIPTPVHLPIIPADPIVNHMQLPLLKASLEMMGYELIVKLEIKKKGVVTDAEEFDGRR